MRKPAARRPMSARGRCARRVLHGSSRGQDPVRPRLREKLRAMPAGPSSGGRAMRSHGETRWHTPLGSASRARTPNIRGRGRIWRRGPGGPEPAFSLHRHPGLGPERRPRAGQPPHRCGARPTGPAPGWHHPSPNTSMDTLPGSPPPDACAACGSTHLTWRVRRQRPVGSRPSRRALLWTCQECGAAREEPLSPAAAPPPLTTG
jgi:hypothetical protein